MRPVTLALTITLACSLALVGCGESKTPETPSPEAAEAAPKDSPKVAKARPAAAKAKAEPTELPTPLNQMPQGRDTPADKAADLSRRREKPAVAGRRSPG